MENSNLKSKVKLKDFNSSIGLDRKANKLKETLWYLTKMFFFCQHSLILQGWNLSGLLGHLFLHADISHLIGNMYILWLFGRQGWFL